MEQKKLKIAVLMGGASTEHEVSLSSGQTVIKNLDKNKYEIKPLKINKAGKWSTPIEELKKEGTDVVFIALHGEYGEDGTVQQELEKAGLSYTGSGPEASALGMDKLKSLKLFEKKGLNVPKFVVLESRACSGDSLSKLKIPKNLTLPLVAKPVSRGSSVGVTIVENAKGLAQAVEEAYKYDERIMVQQYIKGREVTCAVLDNGKNKITPLIPTEIIPKQRSFFDYHSKYVAEATDEITPPNLPQKTIDMIQKVAVLTHRVISASGMSRTDMILGDDNKIYVLEINTIPGMTQNSLLPKGAKALGISFTKMLDRIIKAALNKHTSKSEYQ